jgi:1-acyl-sn-glycerol-3-phosphate acyltransferase
MRTGAADSPQNALKEIPGASEERASAYLWLRTVFRWTLAAGFFFTVCPLVILLGIFVDPQKNDAPQRWLSRTLMWMAGVRVEVRRSPGFDPHSVCFFVSNHVNLFDPFVLYCVTPQVIRGLELESHFRIPVYGWMMKRFGNVPVPSNHSPAELKRMWRMTRDALNSGISLLAFPEGQRTLDGHVGPFKDGVFRMALQYGTPIVPVSLVGSFAFNRKTGWMIRPGTITVVLHGVIETKDLNKEDLPALRERVRAIIAQPVEEWINFANK